MKGLAKKIAIIFVGLILFLYSIFAVFLWINQYQESKVVSNIKSVYSRKKSAHKLTLLKSGIASLKKRIDLIDTATESIELEFFIYELDSASKLITSRLIDASRRGVNVKILVDFSISVFKLAPIYVSELRKEGIDVRYYNTASNTRVISIQHRNHRKLLVIDSQSVFIGGRNIGNDYFDLSANYNFLDTDVLIEGDIVQDIRQSFYSYWESNYASKPKENIGKSLDFFVLDEASESIYNFLRENHLEIEKLNFISTCNDLAYVTDNPGVFVKNRQVYKRMELILKEANETIIAESPYLILRKDGLDLIHSLTKRGVSLEILTNSLKSTDAYYTVGALSLNLGQIKDTKTKLFAFKETTSPYPFSKKTKYGLHSKRGVIDSKHTLIGTYNIDPRSANLNSEVLVICRNNKDLAKEVIADIALRKDRSVELFKTDSPFFELIGDASFKYQVKFFLSLPLSRLFDFLL